MTRRFSRGLSDDQREPYVALPENVSIADVNTLASFGAELSAAMDFDTEDRAPMAELNAVIWYAVKGADVSYPDVVAGSGGTLTRAADGD